MSPANRGFSLLRKDRVSCLYIAFAFLIGIVPVAATAATIISQGPDTDIIQNAPYLEFNNPLLGTEMVDGCPVIEWRDAGFACVGAPFYEDWIVNTPCVSCPPLGCIDGYSNEIWLRQAGHQAKTTTTVAGTTVSIHLHGDSNDGIAIVKVDGVQIAEIDMYTPAGVDNVLIIVRNLPNTPHDIEVLDAGFGAGGTDVAIMGAAVLDCPPEFFWKGGDTNPMYDFDQKQMNWGDICPDSLVGQFTWTWCGPVALANSMCWYAENVDPSLVPDSLRDALGVPDPIRLIEAMAKTSQGGDPGCDGVSCSELEGMAQNWIDCFAPSKFEVHSVPNNDFAAICDELRRSQDVIVLLGFYGDDGVGGVVRTGGHFVTLAGCGTFNGQDAIAFADPYWDSRAVGVTPGRFNGPNGDPRDPFPDPAHHNDPANYSHDLYPIFPDPSGCLGLEGFDPGQQDPFDDQNEGPAWDVTVPGTYIDWVFAVSPVDTTWFWKGGETKPMYDFDQKQAGMGDFCPPPAGPFTPTWCGPVALANSICWYDEHRYPGLVPNFLRDASGNTDPVKLINHITNIGSDTRVTCTGIACDRLQAKALFYVEEMLPGQLWVHSLVPNSFDKICDELRKTQDVILLLGFYQSDGIMQVRTGGHYVTLAGCGDFLGSPAVAFSDPYYDSAAIGFSPGRFNGPHGDPRVGPSDPLHHNNPDFYSHDIYGINVIPGPTDCLTLEGYDANNLGEPFDGQNEAPDLPCILPPGSWTVIDCVISISPWPDPATGVEPVKAPRGDYLAQNYPNPFNPVTTIEYRPEAAGNVTLRVYDVSGRLVRTLVDGHRSAGILHTASWDGLNQGGQTVATGVYFYRLVTATSTQTRKMVLLK